MIRSIRAHFDGRVFVPDEPVDVPINVPLVIRFEVIPVEEASDATGLPEPNGEGGKRPE